MKTTLNTKTNDVEILKEALRSIIRQAEGDLTDADFRKYAAEQIADYTLCKLESNNEA